jgi:hypothetical protein
MTASLKVHPRCCAAPFVIAAYYNVRLIPHDLRALHLELFSLPSRLMTFYEFIKGK